MAKFVTQIFRNNEKYNGVVFLDRDGVINEEVNYLKSSSQIRILPTVINGIKLLNKKNIAVVIITNQPVVARGLISIKELKEINNYLFVKLSKKGAYIDAIYSCPHHPEKNHPDIPDYAMKYRIKCNCRKPELLMYKRAISDFNLKNILGIIGDQTRDIAVAKKLGVKSVLLKTGHGGRDKKYDVEPDYISENFLNAVKKLF